MTDTPQDTKPEVNPTALPDLTRYYGPDELRQMPEAWLEELVDRIPPERLRWYESVFNGSLERLYGHGEVREDSVLELIATLLEEYEVEKKVPVAAVGRWVKVPDKIRRHVEDGADLPPGLDAVEDKTPRRRWLIAGLAAGALVLVAAFSLIGRAAKTEDVASATPDEPRVFAQPTEVVLTPTPLALQAADRVIEKGEDLKHYYPVLLELTPADGEGRVLVVQQKPVETADWDYSRDPDTASWVSGLVIRPVLGIPYSPANEAFLEDMQPGDRVLLRMSTGAVLTFEVDNKARVNRQDTSVFRQVSPGIVVVLLSDPAGDRLILYGSYPTDQELARLDLLRAQQEGEVAQLGETLSDEQTGLQVSVTDATSSDGGTNTPLPLEYAYFMVDMQLRAGEVHLPTTALIPDLADSHGQHYAPVDVPEGLARYPALDDRTLPPHTNLLSSVAFIVPRDMPGDPTFSLVPGSGNPPLSFSVTYQPPSTLTARHLVVMVYGIEVIYLEEETEMVQVGLRLFNPHTEPVAVNLDDLFLVFSPEETEGQFPVGPRVHPLDWQPVMVAPDTAVDVTARFGWDGSPALGLGIGGYRYLSDLQHSE